MAKNQVLTGKNGVNDKLTGADGDDQLYGLGGDDQLKGGGGNDQLYGGEGRDQLEGGAGKDLLDGGLGADTMKGGKDSDAYVVDDAGDIVIENAGEGEQDSVVSSISYTLTENVENLALTGAANLAGTGNGLNNALAGNSGDNVLHGLGGNDVLLGLGGNDRLYGDEGNDLLTGGSGNDVLDGGAGQDIMTGWGGNDSYVVDQSGDLVFELSNGGIDTVTSTVSWTLGNNLENLTLAGSASINGTGNSLDNIIVAAAGANVLRGAAGADTFVFLTPANLNAVPMDTIADFKAGEHDRIDLRDLLGSAMDLHWGNTTPTRLGVWQVGDTLNIDLTDDTNADMVIKMPGITATPLVIGDFLGVDLPPPPPPPPLPVASGDTFIVPEDLTRDLPVLDNDTGSNLQAVIDSQPTKGTLEYSEENDALVYTSQNDYHGSDSFTYHVTDGNNSSAPVTVNLTVVPQNDAPVGENETVTVAPGAARPFSINDFTYSDPHDSDAPNALAAIKVTASAPGLSFGGEQLEVGAPQLVPRSGLANLVYSGTADGSEIFKFQLIDDGSATSGTNTSVSYSMFAESMASLSAGADGSSSQFADVQFYV